MLDQRGENRPLYWAKFKDMGRLIRGSMFSMPAQGDRDCFNNLSGHHLLLEHSGIEDH